MHRTNILRSDEWIAIYESLWTKDGRTPIAYVNCIREESQPLLDRRIVGGNFYMKNYEEDTPFSTWLHRSGASAGWWSLLSAALSPVFTTTLWRGHSFRAGCSRFARRKSSVQTATPILVERSIKKVRRPAFSAEETRIKARKLPLLIGWLIGPLIRDTNQAFVNLRDKYRMYEYIIVSFFVIWIV